MTHFHREFFIHQHYTLTIDDSEIEEERFRRMFQAIIANASALQDILAYRVLGEHTYQSGDMMNFIEAHYEKEFSFVELLVRHGECFSQEDREWLRRLLIDYKTSRAEYKRTGDIENTFDLDLQVHELEESFKAEVSGWDIGEHVHQGKHMEEEREE